MVHAMDPSDRSFVLGQTVIASRSVAQCPSRWWLSDMNWFVYSLFIQHPFAATEWDDSNRSIGRIHPNTNARGPIETGQFSLLNAFHQSE